MLRVVVIDLRADHPGQCFTGFESKEEILHWLVDKGYMEPRWRWIIFNEEQTRYR